MLVFCNKDQYYEHVANLVYICTRTLKQLSNPAQDTYNVTDIHHKL
jgi:hypothetical protein